MSTFKPKIFTKPGIPKIETGPKKPDFKPKSKKARLIKDGKDIAVIAGGGILSGIGVEAARAAHDRKKNSMHQMSVKRAAGAIGVIGAGDFIAEETIDKLKERRERRAKKLVRKGIEQRTEATILSAKPAVYSIARRNLRGKKPTLGIKKITLTALDDKRRTIDMDPKKKSKSSVARDIGIGAGAAAAGGGIAYAGVHAGRAVKKTSEHIATAANSVSRAADIAEKLQKHVGGLATEVSDKVKAHADYIGHHAGEAAEQSTRTAKAARKTVNAYHPRAIGKLIKGGLKEIPLLRRYLSAVRSVIELKAKPEKERSWVDRNGARVVGGALGLGGSLYIASRLQGKRTHIAHAESVVPKTAPVASKVEKKERKPRKKRVEAPITDIRQVPKKGTMLSIIRAVHIEFAEQGHESGTGRFGTVAGLRPSIRAAQGHARNVKRGGEVAQDITDHLRGVKKDPRKKRFWEKEWAKTAAITGAVGIGILGHRVHANKKGYQPYFSKKVVTTDLGAGIAKATVEGIIDAVGLGGATNPDGTKKKKKKQADLSQLRRKVRTIDFYGTSDGVSKSWDTRGRSTPAIRTPHWWTHSPTRNSVRVVHSTSESGPRTRRPKKLHEKSSFKNTVIKVLAGTAAIAGGVAVAKHGQVRKLRKEVVASQQKYNDVVSRGAMTKARSAAKPKTQGKAKKPYHRKGRTKGAKQPGG